MTCPRLVAVALVIFASFAAARVRAETVVVDSAELLVATADIVVRGKISEVKLGPAASDTRVWDRVTVRVTETLRGKKQETVVFVVQQPMGAFATRHLRQLQEEGREVLFFLVRNDPNKKDRPAEFADVALVPHPATEPIDLSGKYPFALANGDFKVLTRPDALLKFVRAAAKATAAPMDGKRAVLPVPIESEAYRTFWAGSSVMIALPVNSRLEARAKTWLAAKDLERRALGVGALKHFKSDDNIRLMKSLLKDPDSEELSTGNKRYRVFPVRAGAVEALDDWGITVERPITKEPLADGK